MRSGNGHVKCQFRIPRPAFRVRIICEFHHVIEIAFGIVAADLQDVHQAWVRAGNRLELLNASKLAVKGMLVSKVVPIHQLRGPEGAHDVTRQPDLTVGPAANGAEQFVVGDAGRRVREVCSGPSRAPGHQGARGHRRRRA